MQLQQKLNKYLKFLAQDTHNVSLLLDITSTYMEMGKFSEAQEYLDRAREIKPESCLEMQGSIHLKNNRFTEAQACFTEAISFNDTLNLKYLLAYSFFSNEQYLEALQVLEPVLEVNDVNIALLQAQTYHRLSEHEKAIAVLERSVEQHKKHAKSLGLLAFLQFEMGEETLAEQYAKACLKIDPKIQEAIFVDILLKTIRGEASIQEIEQLLALNPEDPRLWFGLGNMLLLEQELEAAQNAFQYTLTLDPGFYECHLIQAWCYLLNENLDEAEQHYLYATEIAPDHSEGFGGLGLIYTLKENFVEAGHLIEKALALDEESYLSEVAQTIFYLQGDPERAKKHGQNTLKKGMHNIGKKLEEAILAMESSRTIH